MFLFFFFNDTATTEIYTLSLHDALPILGRLDQPTPVRGIGIESPDARHDGHARRSALDGRRHRAVSDALGDRKSTRLNSSHMSISYAVFCLKKKKNNTSTGSTTHNHTM